MHHLQKKTSYSAKENYDEIIRSFKTYIKMYVFLMSADISFYTQQTEFVSFY